MTVRDDIRIALMNAIDWQLSLAECHDHCNDGVSERCREQVKRFRKILTRRYGIQY
jgi:hypothetical protein